MLLQRNNNNGTTFGASLSPIFFAPFADSGAGAVNLALTNGTGSATFTRATTATTILSTGLIGSVASGTARSAYSPAGVYLGYNAEGQRTNICLWNRDLTNAAWTATSCTVAKTATGADGVTNSASTLTATAGNATVLQPITSGSAARITGCRIKRRIGSGVINMTQDNGGTWTAVTVTAGWTRVSVPSATLTDPNVGFRIVTSGDAIDVDYVQHEVASFLSSDIETITAAVTRNADILSYPASGNILSGLGTVYAEFTPSFVQTGVDQAIIGDTSTAITVIEYTNGSSTGLRFYDGTNADDWTITTAADVSYRRAVRYGSSIADAWSDGVKLTPAAKAFTGTLTLSAIGIGTGNGSRQPFAAIKNVKIFGTALTDAQVAAL